MVNIFKDEDFYDGIVPRKTLTVKAARAIANRIIAERFSVSTFKLKPNDPFLLKDDTPTHKAYYYIEPIEKQ